MKRQGGIIVESPSVDIQTLVQRSINRKKPFNQGDKGFRDTLIWLNTLDMVREYRHVSFVSGNIADYAQGDSLHPDLEDDLAAVLPDSTRFLYFKSLDEFIAFMDRGGRGSASALKNALMYNGYRGFRLDAWIEENIYEILEWEELDGISWTALPYWAEDPRLIELEEIVGIEVHNQHAIHDDCIEFFCDLAIIGTFQCSILMTTWKKMIHPRQIQWFDEESDENWTIVGVRSIGTFLLRIVFDLNIANVIERDIAPIYHNISQAIESLREQPEESIEEEEG